MVRTLGLVMAAVAALGTPVHADSWFSAETPAAVPVSSIQASVFRPGVMPAIGLYTGWPRLALGARLRAGALRDGPTPGEELVDPGLGGLGTASVAARLRIRGGWLEAAAGIGLTGTDVVPALEAGGGWMFGSRSWRLGPSVRVLRVVGRGDGQMFGSATMMLVGVDVTIGRRSSTPRPPAIATPPPRPPHVAVADPVAPPPVEAETEPVPPAPEPPPSDVQTDLAGCLAANDCTSVPIEVEQDRIVLDERVLFDLDRARVRSSGRKVIGEIIALWQQHPEWTQIRIEGHSDVRGRAEYNDWLSQLRASRVRDVFLRNGIAPERLEAIGVGSAHPRDEGSTPEAHRRNRRVEFVIVRGAAP